MWPNLQFPTFFVQCQQRMIWLLVHALSIVSPIVFLFKVNNENIKTICAVCSKIGIKTPERRLTSFWCLHYQLWTSFTHCSSVSIIDFEQKMLTGWAQITLSKYGSHSSPKTAWKITKSHAFIHHRRIMMWDFRISYKICG